MPVQHLVDHRHQPLRMAPGTRMPQAFVDGKSVLMTVLNGDPAGQAEAMWSYLSLGPGLPLPEVLETGAIFRATARTITLDDTLRAESVASGLAYAEP